MCLFICCVFLYVSFNMEHLRIIALLLRRLWRIQTVLHTHTHVFYGCPAKVYDILTHMFCLLHTHTQLFACVSITYTQIWAWYIHTHMCVCVPIIHTCVLMTCEPITYIHTHVWPVKYTHMCVCSYCTHVCVWHVGLLHTHTHTKSCLWGGYAE